MREVGAIPLSLSEDEHAIDAAIATRELLTRRFADELLQLRRRRNGTISTICRLPEEILTEIFTLLVHEARHTSNYGCADLSWIWLTHVCSRWRTIMRSLPKLWTIIYTTNDRECIDAFLTRSRRSPLSVISRKPECMEDLAFPFLVMLLPVTDRIQHIKLSVRYRIMLDLLSLSHTRVPLLDASILETWRLDDLLLETLELSYMPTNSEEEWRLLDESPEALEQFWPLSEAETRMPKLRTLCLTGFPLALANNLARPSLTKLRVRAPAPFDILAWETILNWKSSTSRA